jgi:hypothetical protein
MVNWPEFDVLEATRVLTMATVAATAKMME